MWNVQNKQICLDLLESRLVVVRSLGGVGMKVIVLGYSLSFWGDEHVKLDDSNGCTPLGIYLQTTELYTLKE